MISNELAKAAEKEQEERTQRELMDLELLSTGAPPIQIKLQ